MARLTTVHTKLEYVDVLRDTFTGTGALTAHTPDVYPTGSAWAILNGAFGNLSGGYLPYSSGTYGLAIIDTGLADFEMRCIVKSGSGVGQETGVAFRSNSDGTNHFKITIYPTSTVNITRFSGLTTPRTNIGGTYVNTPTFVNTVYYTLDIICHGGDLRFYVNGSLAKYAVMSDFLTNTYVGQGTVQAFGSWDYLRVQAIHGWKSISICGDSISNGADEWPYIASALYKHGRSGNINHAASGAGIGDFMESQVTSCISDAADMTIIALGTNDDTTDRQTLYHDQITRLYTALGKPIYCMGVLPKTTSGSRDIVNAYISAAVADAAGDGVNCTYWNTDGWISPSTDTSDGLHPNATGQLKIAYEVLKRLP